MKTCCWSYMAVMALVLMMGLTGCHSVRSRSNDALNAAQWVEPAWVRNAEPVEFEGQSWFPTDNVENLLEYEVYQAGVYRDRPFFIDRQDVRPFERIYIRFAPDKYRACEKQP